jgi:hypothetical protein
MLRSTPRAYSIVEESFTNGVWQALRVDRNYFKPVCERLVAVPSESKHEATKGIFVLDMIPQAETTQYSATSSCRKCALY